MNKRICTNLIIFILFLPTIALRANDLDNLPYKMSDSEPDFSAYSLDGGYYIMANRDIHIYNTKTRKKVLVITDEALPIHISISQTSNNFAVLYKSTEFDTANKKYDAVLYSLPDGKEIKRVTILNKDQSGFPTNIELSPKEDLIATLHNNKIIVVDWDGKEIWSFDTKNLSRENSQGETFAVSKDWKYFLYKLQRIEYPSKEVSSPIKFDEKYSIIRDGIISQDGKFAVVCGHANAAIIRKFDLENGTMVYEQKTEGTNRILGTDDLSIIVTENAILWPDKNIFVKYKPYTNSFGIDSVAYDSKLNEVSVGLLFFNLKNIKTFKSNAGEGLWIKRDISDNKPNDYILANNEIITNNSWQKILFNLSTHKITVKSKDRISNTFGTSILVNYNDDYGVNQNGQIIFKVDTKKEPLQIPLEKDDRVNGASFSQNEQLALITNSNMTYIFDIKDQKLINKIKTNYKLHYKNILIANSAKVFISIDYEAAKLNLKVSNSIDGSIAWELPTFHENVMYILTPDDTHLVIGKGKKIQIYNLEQKRLKSEIKIERGSIKSFSFSEDGKTLLVNNNYGYTQFYDFEKETLIKTVMVANKKDQAIFDKEGKLVFVSNKLYLNHH